MGQAVIAAAAENADATVTATVDAGDDFAGAMQECDAVIDFSHHSALPLVLARCMEQKKTLVVGTTGHSDVQIAAIHHAAQEIPIVYAPNFSVGVNTLFWLTRKAAEILGAEFDLEVVEMHHRMKKDAPSGTAKRLAEILAEVRQVSYNEEVRHGRQGIVGERTKAEIGIHAIRGGDVVGDHTVIFANTGERMELTHKASSRDTFARGAVLASVWAHGKPAGMYDMEDVLGLSAVKA